MAEASPVPSTPSRSNLGGERGEGMGPSLPDAGHDDSGSVRKWPMSGQLPVLHTYKACPYRTYSGTRVFRDIYRARLALRSNRTVPFPTPTALTTVGLMSNK